MSINKNKKLIIRVFVMIIFVMVIGAYLIFSNNYDFKYRDNGIPGHYYEIKLDPKSRNLIVEVTNYSSAVDVETTTSKYSTTLTKDEFSRIKSIYRKADKDSLANILELIAEDEKPFGDTETGTIITCREFGNKMLNDLIDELK